MKVLLFHSKNQFQDGEDICVSESSNCGAMEVIQARRFGNWFNKDSVEECENNMEKIITDFKNAFFTDKLNDCFKNTWSLFTGQNIVKVYINKYFNLISINSTSSSKSPILILNDVDFRSGIGGQATFIKNLDPFLGEKYNLTYMYLPNWALNWTFIPTRLKYLIYVSLFLLKNKKKFKLIISHTPEASFISTFFNIPLIHIFHGNANPLTKSKFWFGKYFKNLFDHFEKRIIKYANLLLTVGEARPDAKKILNPILHDIPPVSTQNKNHLIFAGRLEEVKNIDKIIESYALLPESIRNIRFLRIFGSGTQENRLKKLTEKLGLKNQIIFEGHQPNDKIIEAISESSLLLMASSHEGFPMVIAESLSVGTPVVSTNVGDIASFIKNGSNGELLSIECENLVYTQAILKVLEKLSDYSNEALLSSQIFNSKEIALDFVKDIEQILINDFSN